MKHRKNRSEPARLPPPAQFGAIKGSAGAFLLRPWFDAAAVKFVTDLFIPLSRAWAVAVACDGDREAFSAEIGDPVRKIRRLDKVLGKVKERTAQYREAASEWEEAFFGAGERSPEALVRAEMDRAVAADAYGRTRMGFMPLRRFVPRVKWAVDTPEEVQKESGKFLHHPAEAFLPSIDAEISCSRWVEGPHGPEGWIRTISPVLGDVATARVFRPKGAVKGTVVWLHGVGLEPEMWLSLADPVNQLVEKGYCVIQPEGPWHGRRTPAGAYGGEIVFARGAAGFINLFRAWVTETALWCGWAHREMGHRVAVGGISLGALTSQLVASVCGNWPDNMTPDACLLVTTTNDVIEGALHGSLARRLGLGAALHGAGWTEEALREWEHLIEPRETPAIAPENIIMLLGSADTVTPYHGGAAMADQWGVPDANRFVEKRGHFSSPLGLYRDPTPLWRLGEILERTN